MYVVIDGASVNEPHTFQTAFPTNYDVCLFVSYVIL